ncbi:helix-turn-helix transcriptional regulator [Candidatus Palauibacter polyketidifaciens]|uniref:helix-turn-helix domain-containing protein n=1 Tax=Candidatus Palauibacter polyketidifaciens TaxID=3056740 RepID=UPI00139B57AE|nr:helix-turn-helix transcriptional regulator [Candidatus Palauibacter polyketidifaciens]MDE2721464.1 helix-turn-helix transcriptional regulator [Candidatus Palauibacter polyketidifaciens]MYE33552.1 helix-turn-helix transcriptional regulator [Gemmatimonadales bacterium]
MADETLTSRALRIELGRRLAKLRLARNVTQRTLAEDAGIGLRTLRRIEAGQSCGVDSLLRVAIALDLGEGLLNAVPPREVRPIERVDSGGKERQRARPRKGASPDDPWSWAEDPND